MNHSPCIEIFYVVGGVVLEARLLLFYAPAIDGGCARMVTEVPR